MERRIVVSYCSEDRFRARHIVQMLREAGFTVFWDQDLQPRQDFRAVIAREIQLADCTLVLWSRSSIGSPFVTDEASLARRIGNYVPVLLAKVRPPLGLRSEQFLWLDHWDGSSATSAWGQLLAVVRGDTPFIAGEELPFDAFSEMSLGLTMVPLVVPVPDAGGLRMRRIAVSLDLVKHREFACWPSAPDHLGDLGHPFASYATPTYPEAVEFCTWLSDTSKRRYRLLDDAEFDAIAKAIASGSSDLVVSPHDNVNALKHFLHSMWTWIAGTERRPLEDTMIDVAHVRGGCWTTAESESVPKAVLTTSCRLPFVGLRVAVDFEVSAAIE